MKKAYLFKSASLWLMCLLFSGFTFGQHKAEKELTYSFAMQPSGSFVIDNRYGNVVIEGWDEPRLSIKMMVKVDHRDRDKAYNLLDRIEATVLEGQDFVNITSTIRDKRTSFFNDLFKDIKEELNSNNTNVDIDYDIKLPKDLKIDVTNIFGDIILSNCAGDLNADLSHGTLRINSLVRSADLKLKYAKLNVRDLPDTELDMNNSEAYITTAKNIIVESRSSDYEIERLDNFKIVGTRDKIRIDELEYFSGNVKYTSVQIREVGKSMDLTMQLGDLRCDRIDGQEAKIRIEQRGSDVDINVTEAAFVLEATMQGGSLRLPESAENISQEYIDEERDHRTVRASFGDVTIGTMIIRGAKGNIVLRDF